MPLDTALSGKTLLEEVASGLTRYYELNYEEYHLEYPRLLAKGYPAADIAKRLEKSPDIVKFHLGRLWSCLPSGFARNPDMVSIMAQGLAVFEKDPRPAKPTEMVRPVYVPSPPPPPKAAKSPEPAMAPPAPTKPQRLEPIRRPAPPPRATPAIDPNYAGELDDPNDDLLVARINEMTPSQRKLLAYLITQSEPPESEQIGAALNIEATSAVAMVSSMYATLGLPSKDRANRHTRALQRHNRIRQIMQHPEVKPPRANHHKETPAAKKEEKAPRVILPVPNKVEQQMSQLLPRELELLMALAEFGESSPTVSELIEARSPRLEKYLSATMESLWSKIGLYRPAGATDKDWGVYRQKILRDILGLTG